MFNESTLSTVQGGNPKHSEDALIAATAELEADVLVTNDGQLKRRLRKSQQTRASPIQIWKFEDFRQFVCLLTAQ